MKYNKWMVVGLILGLMLSSFMVGKDIGKAIGTSIRIEKNMNAYTNRTRYCNEKIFELIDCKNDNYLLEKQLKGDDKE